MLYKQKELIYLQKLEKEKMYTAYCKTDNKGRLHIYNVGPFNNFFGENPSMDFKMIIEPVNNKPGNKLFSYLHAEVLPKLIEGFRKLGENHNKASIAEEMKKYITVVWKTEIQDSKPVHFAVEFEDLNFFERKRYIDEAIVFAANELETVIEDPK